MDWIMSEGGPLICMDRHLEASWGGVSRISCPSSKSGTDYDRACKVTTHLSSIPLQDGLALVIGEEPLDTSVWYSPDGRLYIIRVAYADLDADFEKIMAGLVSSVFDKPREVLNFSFSNSELVMFDSAEPGNVVDKKTMRFSIVPGEYRIVTQIYDPDDENSLVLHRFDLMTKLDDGKGQTNSPASPGP